MVDREEAAAASIAGLAELYAHTGRLSWNQAKQQVQDRLAAWEIRPKRIGEVMAKAATCRHGGHRQSYGDESGRID